MDPRSEELICKVIDGQATQDEKNDLEALMARDPDLRSEFEAQQSLQASLKLVGLREMQDDVADTYWNHIYHRLEHRLGWVLSVIGILAAMLYGMYALMTKPGLAPTLRYSLCAVILGLGLLFAGVLRLRLRVRRTERYSEIIR